MQNQDRFNPRTRVGCDGANAAAINQANYVSIHAPAWGATALVSLALLIHSSFNPRTRVGCDAAGFHDKAHAAHVSIHAPAWGATPLAVANLATRAMFQSTHPRGVRQLSDSVSYWLLAFQSTHPRGVRPVRGVVQGYGQGGFNPRTRVGCDLLTLRVMVMGTVFQSTHPRGVRLERPEVALPGGVVSIHAPAWGATFIPTRLLWDKWVSIHAPAWGATCTTNCLCILYRMFQSTHPRGVRLNSAKPLPSNALFQSTHPRGVRLFPCFIQ